jgi:hypothetical protein
MDQVVERRLSGERFFIDSGTIRHLFRKYIQKLPVYGRIGVPDTSGITCRLFSGMGAGFGRITHQSINQ